MNLNDEKTSVKKTNPINPIILFQSNIINNISNYIYVTKGDYHTNPLLVGISTSFDTSQNTTSPKFLIDYAKIKIPKGVRRTIEREIPKALLDKISLDRNKSIELCLLVASFLMPSLYKDEWITLSSKKLDELTKTNKDNTWIYTHILNVLKYSSERVKPIIIVKTDSQGKEIYRINHKSKQFKLNDCFHGKGFEVYTIKNEPLLIVKKQEHLIKLNNALQNIIGNNLIQLCSRITLPTNKEIIAHAKRLIKEGYRTKKGKVLKFLNNRKREKIKDYKNISFVEMGITKFHFLIDEGFKIPIPSFKKAGGRVYDAFNTMNSWIRSLIKIDGEETIEKDFKALHPNLIMAIYGGKIKYITHEKIAQTLNVDVKMIKIEHLAFFNQHPEQMKKSIVYNYYKEHEPKMLEKVIKDKYKYGHEITSSKLFTLEVKIMSEAIQILNEKDIVLGYTFDALFCKKSVGDLVEKTMNEVAILNNVFTVAK
jgi:hypothetical protein